MHTINLDMPGVTVLKKKMMHIRKRRNEWRVGTLGEAGWALKGWSRTLVGSSLGQGMSS